jgi:hypothetical protein
LLASGSDYSSILQKIIPLDYLPKPYSGTLDYSLPKAVPLKELIEELKVIEYVCLDIDRLDNDQRYRIPLLIYHMY